MAVKTLRLAGSMLHDWLARHFPSVKKRQPIEAGMDGGYSEARVDQVRRGPGTMTECLTRDVLSQISGPGGLFARTAMRWDCYSLKVSTGNQRHG